MYHQFMIFRYFIFDTKADLQLIKYAKHKLKYKNFNLLKLCLMNA